MTITVGERLPNALVLKMNDAGPEQIAIADLFKRRKVVLFGLPGAFTGTCSTSHIPSFIRTQAKFAEKGIHEVICVSVNDPFVMQAWGEATGAEAAGITMLADAASEFTLAAGLAFSAPDVGFSNRSRRYALYAEDGVVKVLHLEEGLGVCDISGGESMLAAI
jgi:peroxiredoxin